MSDRFTASVLWPSARDPRRGENAAFDEHVDRQRELAPGRGVTIAASSPTDSRTAGSRDARRK